MRILALDAAMARCSAAWVVDGGVIASGQAASGRGQQSALALMAAGIMADQPAPDAVAVSVGPGSFTGLRSAIALAHGLAAGICPVIGVTVAEALAEAVGALRGRTLWTAIDSRRGRIFLDADGALRAVDLADLPQPSGPVAVAGDAANAVAAILAGRGCDVWLTDVRLPHAEDVAAVAWLRLTGALPPLAAQPLYVDPPEAKLPAGGLRPGPVA
jgi:tRNA threonylcarbamoyl adenosine modification protein YeaZ